MGDSALQTRDPLAAPTARMRLNPTVRTRMSQNVPQCPTMSHPNGPNGTSAPSDNDLSDNDLQDFNVPECPIMSHNVPLLEKTGPALVGSRFKVQCWGFRTKCDGMLQSTLQNVTECYGMLHPNGAHPAISTDKQRLTRTDATECYEMLRNATVCEKGGSETCARGFPEP